MDQMARWCRWIPVCAGLVALAVYVCTLAPDLTWAHDGADGGDLITASFVGGAAHPPGYPLYALLGRAFAALPVGSIPYRYNLFSALAAAGAAALVAWAVQEAGPVPSLAAGLALAFAPGMWSQAVIAETYAGTALLAAVVVALSVRTRAHPLALGVAFGLGLTHHLTLVLLAPLALAAWSRWAKAQGARRVVLLSVTGLAVGLAPWAYLPLTAGAPAGWGDASTPEGFWWLVSAQLYRGYALSLPAEWIVPRVAAVARVLSESFTWIGVAAGLWGLGALWTRDRGRVAGSLISALAVAAFAVGYNTTDSQVYLIPALVLFAVWIGLGWGEIGRGWLSAWKENQASRRRHTAWRAGLYALMLTAPAMVLVRGWPTQDLRGDQAARHFVDGVMSQAPANAIVVTDQDRHTFALWVGAFVERQRPDLAVVDQDLLSFDWYRARLRRGFPGLAVPEMPDVDELPRANPGRPVCRPTGDSPPWLRCEER